MLKKRIPTVVGLILLLIGVIGGVVFINQGTNFLPRAAPEYVPQKVTVTNITETSFVVSWLTAEPSVGFIKGAANPLNLSEVFGDDRDQLSGSKKEYRTHYVTVQNLNPLTTYYFKIGSQKDQLYDNNGQPFTVSLPKAIDNKPAADTAFGTVMTSVNTPAEGAILYLSIPGGTPLSALVKQNGNWAINLLLSRSTDLSSYVAYDPQTTKIDILIQYDEAEPTVAVTTTGNDQPVPTIVINGSNDFAFEPTSRIIQASPEPGWIPASEVNASVETANSTGSSVIASKFYTGSLLEEETTNIAVTSIPTDGIIHTLQPELSGLAPSNTPLTLTLHSSPIYTAGVTSDNNGRWQWLVPQPLESGEHVLTITYSDTQGKVHSTQKSFIVEIASLQQVDLAYAATPAASPAFSPTPKPTILPTSSPSPSPSITPTATGSANLVPGTTSLSVAIIVLGIILLGSGISVRRLFPRW